MDSFKVKAKQTLFSEDSSKQASLIQKLDITCSQMTRDLYRKKINHSELVKKMSSDEAELETLRQELVSSMDQLEREQEYLRILCLGGEIKRLKIQVNSLHRQLRHRSSNQAQESTTLKELTQLEMAKAKAEEEKKATDQEFPKYRSHLDSKENVEHYIRYLTSIVDSIRKKESARQYSIKRLQEEIDVLEKHINFLRKKLAQIYQRKEAASQHMYELN